MKAGKKSIIKGGALLTAVSGCLCAFPTFAFAAEEKSGVSVILPDMNEFIPMLVAFIILVIVLAKFGWPIFDRIVTTRDNTIKDSLQKAEAARIEGERALEEYRSQLEDAKKQAAQIVADAKTSAEVVKADITAKAQEEADLMLEKARNTIESERKAAVADLQKSAAELSVSVAGKIIGQDLSDDEHRKIIERYVAEAGSFNAD